MKEPRPHDLLRVFGLDTYLPADAPVVSQDRIHGSSWVVTLGPTPKSRAHPSVRGPNRSQRYTLTAPDHCVVDMVAPEDVAGCGRGHPVASRLRSRYAKSVRR